MPAPPVIIEKLKAKYALKVSHPQYSTQTLEQNIYRKRRQLKKAGAGIGSGLAFAPLTGGVSLVGSAYSSVAFTRARFKLSMLEAEWQRRGLPPLPPLFPQTGPNSAAPYPNAAPAEFGGGYHTPGTPTINQHGYNGTNPHFAGNGTGMQGYNAATLPLSTKKSKSTSTPARRHFSHSQPSLSGVGPPPMQSYPYPPTPTQFFDNKGRTDVVAYSHPQPMAAAAQVSYDGNPGYGPPPSYSSPYNINTAGMGTGTMGAANRGQWVNTQPQQYGSWAPQQSPVALQLPPRCAFQFPPCLSLHV
ncbi:hypothetical protein BOTBODRAFT_176262 [Botryobasidium botryosum FD-172 SS1]|uniref:Uncharacterized protein n=1 Tax=Botryobasidium botryosum (strain FD-172 SS1) TaxID=930990 RepID=A0A067MAG9_BOTB1|nr:hypothetical protein BOTBODRAFT_176262 [Botryobasidium botryosum FD-172 SS1]